MKAYEVIAQRFLDQLNKGTIPWEKPWLYIGEGRHGAWGHGDPNKENSGGVPYSVLNQMMLPGPGEYITYHQAQLEGGRIKEGAKGYPIMFYSPLDIKVKNPDTNVDEDKTIPVLKYYTVFRLEDTEGVEQRYYPDPSPYEGMKEPQKCKEAERIIKEYVGRTKLNIVHEAGDRAYYNPVLDKVVVPLKKQFSKKAEYYSTLFHELIHSTGHRDRLNRLSTMTAARGKEYSVEELVAEIGAATMLFNLGIETKASINNSNAYLQSWASAINNDKMMVIKAAQRAGKAVKYLMFGEQVRPCKDTKPIDHSKEVKEMKIEGEE